MPYQANIPQPNDQLSVSQVDILGNFQALGVIGGNTNANSSSLNNIAGFNYLYLPVQGANPPVGTAFANTVAMFSFLNPTTGQDELYINKRNQITNVQIPATASILSQTSAPAVNSNGYTYFPSGIIMKWRQGTAGAGGYSMNGAGLGPNYTQVIMAWVTGNTVTAGVASTFAVTSIVGATVNVGGAAPGFFYILSIGY